MHPYVKKIFPSKNIHEETLVCGTLRLECPGVFENVCYHLEKTREQWSIIIDTVEEIYCFYEITITCNLNRCTNNQKIMITDSGECTMKEYYIHMFILNS